jgi:hypothetical protein
LEQATYPDELLALVAKRIPEEMISVFGEIWNHWNDHETGITWTSLVQIIEDRYIVEKALLLLETTGFVSVESSPLDRRSKRYLPDPTRGIQLAKFIRDQKIVRNS